MKIKPSEDLYYALALHFSPNIGSRFQSMLIARFGSAKAVLEAPLKELLSVEGVGELRAKSIKNSEGFKAAAEELRFIEKENITVLRKGDEQYPKRLLQCADAPELLFFKGDADLNKPKHVAVVGTRAHTEYGSRCVQDLVRGLATCDDLCIISGLANGIDTVAHKTALAEGLPTVGVLGNGLHTVYPPGNKKLAEEMLHNGGLLTEFASVQKLDKGNFPARNRIVAGISDVTIVIESGTQGGALITASLANSYNREVAAFPGRAYDEKSVGTNKLISSLQASMITSADDVLRLMNWDGSGPKAFQQKLFDDLSEDEQKILRMLQQKDAVHADELLAAAQMNYSQLASILLGMEMRDLLKSLPGKFYRIN